MQKQTHQQRVRTEYQRRNGDDGDGGRRRHWPAAAGQQAAAAAAARARAKQNLKGKRLGATYIGEKNRSGLRKGGAGWESDWKEGGETDLDGERGRARALGEGGGGRVGDGERRRKNRRGRIGFGLPQIGKSMRCHFRKRTETVRRSPANEDGHGSSCNTKLRTEMGVNWAHFTTKGKKEELLLM